MSKSIDLNTKILSDKEILLKHKENDYGEYCDLVINLVLKSYKKGILMDYTYDFIENISIRTGLSVINYPRFRTSDCKVTHYKYKQYHHYSIYLIVSDFKPIKTSKELEITIYLDNNDDIEVDKVGGVISFKKIKSNNI